MKTPFVLADNVFDRVNLYPQGSIAQIDPAQILLQYAPGDAIAGESFTRASTATYIDGNGVVQSSAINGKRHGHYSGTLLEDTRTNGLIRSQEFDNVVWGKGGSTITANNAAAPDGTVTADKLCEDASNGAHYVTVNLTTTASTNQPCTIFVAAAERSWVRLTSLDRAGVARDSWINLGTAAVGTKDAGHTIRIVALTAGWRRIEMNFNSGVGAGAVAWFICVATADAVATYAGTVGSGIYIWGAQHEQDQLFASSYIPTVAATVTRAADSYSMPFTESPREMTLYTKLTESGTVFLGGNKRVAFIGSAANAVPQLALDATASFYDGGHNNGLGGVASLLGVTPAFGDTVELALKLFADGSIQVSQSVNGGAETLAAQSVANALAAAWSAQLVWLNSTGPNFVGFTAIQSFKIASGVRSLAAMRGSMSSASVVGREPNYAADYRRERTYYQPAVSAAAQGLVADLGTGNTQLCDSCWIDRGHNLWGKTVKIWAGSDGIAYPESVSLVVPAFGTLGGDPTAGWCVTEEGAIYTLFGGFTARRWWKVTVTEAWQPIVTGIILGKRVQLLGYSSVVDEDAGERSNRSEQSLIPGYAGDDRTYSARKVELRLSQIGAAEYDSSIRTLRRLLFDINQAAVVCMNYGTAPERAWLYKYQGTAWSSPKTRIYRSATIALFEYGPAIR